MLMATPEEINQAMVIRIANALPPGARHWLLMDGPDPKWNNGARAMAWQALERRGLTTRYGLSTLGKQVQRYVRRVRGLE